MDKSGELEYAGFWIRLFAAILDSVLIAIVTLPILWGIYGNEYFDSGSEYFEMSNMIRGFWDFIISWVLPAVAVILFWIYRSATPGKMYFELKVVDAATGEKPALGQSIIRYLGYFVSTLPLLLGLIWVAFDKKKQGWHDKIANTYVIIDKQ
ncbi:MAG: RDD family protein [Candidatus Dadabacteria bacterium]|nr:RDD family protein [Candidatus Dadabacteria bacterium]NIS09127.1 RDD family protein [Candidatus Dadabacteria bacterium]NIV41560.1 RDD family protein [Candidatus Dadabacteria bacterium]NIX15705.1 RDD family protein [Candidatus Dadabacteria bacterium]NIY22435.1 RDD family protein [Candidatus Dadabacteria bacterium]